MRRLLAALGVLAAGFGTTACTTTTSATTTTDSTTSTSSVPSTTAVTRQGGTEPRGDRAAVADMEAALGHGLAETSLHYQSTSVGSGLTTTIVGDVNRSSGEQTIVVSYKGATASMVIDLVGHVAYFKGAAAAIEVLINLGARQSAAAAGRWVSVVPADKSTYANTAAALTVGSVMSELSLSSPVTGARSLIAGGHREIRISGAWTGEGITPADHAIADLYVSAGARSLPVRFTGLMPKTASLGQFEENLVLGGWGEPVHVAAPRSSVPLSTILRTTTTTTQPVVV